MRLSRKGAYSSGSSPVFSCSSSSFSFSLSVSFSFSLSASFSFFDLSVSSSVPRPDFFAPSSSSSRFFFILSLDSVFRPPEPCGARGPC